MPPPRTRRAGHSRKAQYGLFFGYVIAVTGMLVAVLLLALSAFDPRGYQALVGMTGDATSRLSGGGRGAVRAVGDAADAVVAYVEAGSKNRALTQELEASRTQLVEAEALAGENAQLRALLGLRQAEGGAIASARLVASTAASARRFATIDQGSGDGVRPGQPVRAAAGLIGRVEAVGLWSARVQLLADAGNVVPVRRASDGLPGIATGTGEGGMDIRPLVSGSNPFRLGDLIVTSGVGGVYAPGTPVGTIVRLSADGAIVRPRADPARTDFALVYPIYLPSLPSPAPPAE